MTATISAERSHRVSMIGAIAATKKLDIVHSEFEVCPPDDML